MCVIAAATALATSPAGATDLTLDVTAPVGAGRQTWPLTTGIPFPRGARSAVDDLRLEAAAGRRAAPPVQARVLSRWPDGSIRWALLDSQIELAGGEQRRYRITRGAPVAAPRPLRVEETPDAVVVDTGPLQFAIPTTRPAALDAVRLGGRDALAGPITMAMEIEGTRHDAGVPTQVRVLERGPLRARVEMRGTYGADVGYVIRVDAFAGQPFVRVLHTFEHRGAAPLTRVGQIAMEVPLRAAAPAGYRAGRERDAPLSGALADAPVSIYQEDNLTLRRDGTVEPGRSAGWIDVGDGTHGVAIAARFLWQQYPQSFHLSRAQLRYNLWAPEADPAAVGMGAAKTHEWVVYFHGAAAPAAEQLAALAEPLVPVLGPDAVASTAALPNSLAPAPATAGFLDEVRAGFERYRLHADREPWDDSGNPRCTGADPERRRQGFYGMFNWGDWNFPGYHDVVNGCDTWGNLEYDLTQVLALAYAATGDAAFHTAMTAAARHFMDVDIVHSAAPPCRCAGMNHPRASRHFTFAPGVPDPGYTWTEGLLSYFYLTGDDRALEAANGIADYLARNVPDNGAATTPRQWGWPPIALLAAADATGQAAYRDAALEYARRAMAAYPPTSGGDFGVGTLADALAYVHAHTGDAAVREWLVGHAAAVMSSPPGADARYFPAVAYVGRISSDPRYQQAAAAAAARQIFGEWGKPFTLAGRTGFRILSLTQ